MEPYAFCVHNTRVWVIQTSGCNCPGMWTVNLLCTLTDTHKYPQTCAQWQTLLYPRKMSHKYVLDFNTLCWKCTHVWAVLSRNFSHFCFCNQILFKQMVTLHPTVHNTHLGTCTTFLVSVIFLSSRFWIYFCSFALFTPSFFSSPRTGLNFCHLLRSNQTHMVLVGQSRQRPTLLHAHLDASGRVWRRGCLLWESNNKLTKLRVEILQSHPVIADNWL